MLLSKYFVPGELQSKLLSLSYSVNNMTAADGGELLPTERLKGGILGKLITPKDLYGSSRVHAIPCETKGKIDTTR